jgi:hypothetical protein
MSLDGWIEVFLIFVIAICIGAGLVHLERRRQVIEAEKSVLIPPNISLSDVISQLDDRACTVQFTGDGYIITYEED